MESLQSLASVDVEAELNLPAKPPFAPLKQHDMSNGRIQFRIVSVPLHRYSPRKKSRRDIHTPVYEHMKIDIRVNLKARKVELKTRCSIPQSQHTDFVQALLLGFDVVALLRLGELYVEPFEIKDVNTLRGDHRSRSIGRLSGKGGRTKFAIGNDVTKTRIEGPEGANKRRPTVRVR